MEKVKNNSKHNINIEKDSDRIEKNKDFIRIEGFNSLRSNVRICLKKDIKNKILVTSPVAREGKSTCSCNLALSFANTGKNVIIIDCDMRKPVIHKTFGLNNKCGLSNILSRLNNIEDCIQKTSYEHLSIISAGENVPNPSELLSGEEMKELIKELEEQYDYVIFDCPPINIVADAVSLFELVDGVVLVTRYGNTTHQDLQKALATITFASANLFGVFFYSKPLSTHKKYGYRYKYNNKYGNYYNE